MSNTCAECHFWRRLNARDLYDDEKTLVLNDNDDRVMIGDCQRYPPQFDGVEFARLNDARMKQIRCANSDNLSYSRLVASKFPATWEFDSCGEFRPRDG